jgi:hypothetical protein
MVYGPAGTGGPVQGQRAARRHFLSGLPGCTQPEAVTHKARPMFAPSTVPFVPASPYQGGSALWTILTPALPQMQQKRSLGKCRGRRRQGGSPLRLILLGPKAPRRGSVLPSQVSAQDAESARVALVLVIASVVFFWRFMLRVMLAIVAVAAGLGLLVLLQNLNR